MYVCTRSNRSVKVSTKGSATIKLAELQLLWVGCDAMEGAPTRTELSGVNPAV
jgi:hypothetical protein